MQFKPQFVASIEELLGEREAAELLAALDSEPITSIRLNPYKLAEKPAGDAVAWNRYGLYLPERPNFTLDPAFAAGAYYVQEAGSMLVEELMRRGFDDCEGLRVLDLCASPGGKSTLLATLVGLEGLVVANEPIRARVQPLVDNAIKWGLGNIAVIHNDPAALGALRDRFDAVLVDAPCSGEGMMRKHPEARAQWSADSVALCAARQRRIVAEGWCALRPGGLLIYSTCTFNRRENEDNVRWMVDELGAEPCELPATDPATGIVCGEAAGIATFRFFPHRVRAEGFFAAAMRKPAGKARPQWPRTRAIPLTDADKAAARALAAWVEQPERMTFARVGERYHGYFTAQYPFLRALSGAAAVVYSGATMGELMHGKLRPDHALAQFVGLSPHAAPRAELPTAEALAYLRKQEVDPARLVEGFNLACHEGLPLGWVKRIGGRANNLYPRELRILTRP